MLHNLHTGDFFNEVFYANGRYMPDALAEATRVLRDWRNGDEHPIDPRLFDALHEHRRAARDHRPFLVISGYRSPHTNAMLTRRSSGVAEHSQHMLGKAIDVRVQGVELRHLRIGGRWTWAPAASATTRCRTSSTSTWVASANGAAPDLGGSPGRTARS